MYLLLVSDSFLLCMTYVAPWAFPKNIQLSRVNCDPKCRKTSQVLFGQQSLFPLDVALLSLTKKANQSLCMNHCLQAKKIQPTIELSVGY